MKIFESDFEKTYNELDNIDNMENEDSVLATLNSLIQSTSTDVIHYSDITALFNLHLENKIKEHHKTAAREVWKNIRNVVKQKKDPFNHGWLKALQYYYNAYITEEVVKNNLPELSYITGSEEHNTLHPDATSTNDPDFSDANILGKNCTVEVKTYIKASSWDSYCRKGNDRKDFHNADFILSYIISSGRWFLTANEPGEWATSIPLPTIPNLVYIPDKNPGEFTLSYFK